LLEEIAGAEPRVEALRAEIARLERYRLDERDLRTQATRFDDLWKVMGFAEQVRFLGALVEKVGCDSCSGKLRVSFISAGIKDVCEKGAA
jgi:hypothetical protein